MSMLVLVDQLNKSAARFYNEPSISKKEEPDLSFLAPEKMAIDSGTEGAQKPAPAGALSVEENLEKRKEMLASLGQEPVDFAFERAIGNNDSVYSNFCEFIVLAKRKVGRIAVKQGNTNVAYATGFMVSERLLLTNWHVFQSIDQVGESEVEFFYELDVFGRPINPAIFELASEDFFYSFEKLDYCLVAVKPADISGRVKLSSIGYHYLDPTLGKLGEEGKELLNIIHHPDGDYKQLSIRENRFTKILDNTIWYETDTAPGSSGSPVFNDQWQVVALHHMGVPAMTADGKHYADKDGNPVLPVGDKIDSSKINWIANEGIRISVLLNDVFARYPNDQLVLGLKKPSEPSAPPPDDIAVSPFKKGTGKEEGKTMENNNAGDVRISFPAALLETNGNISININNRPGGLGVPAGGQLSLTGGETDDLLEVKKIETENAMDYSGCSGYDESFLGINIPLPKPKTDVLKFVAKLKSGNKSILDYYFFSTIHHSVRKMPMISAINVDGDPDLRKDMAQRVDVWLRDNRLDYEMQLNDKFYSGSGFDKGHMSRREDADYGATEDLAKKHADMTCVYTNACPQVPALNRSNKIGLWGKLEKVVLEKGVKKESGQTAKISVFNGPIFSDNDRFFKGIQIPVEYWKIILWFDEDNKLQATAFKLSQADLVGSIDFEKLDFDTNAEFQEYHCSIKSLEDLTNLDFSDILGFDTFTGANPNESLKLGSEEELNNLIEGAFTTKSLPPRD